VDAELSSAGHQAREAVAAGPETARADELTRDALLAVAPAERRGTLAASLGSRIARLLGMEGRQPAPSRPLTSLGLDSLAACELKADLDASFLVPVSLGQLLSGATIEDLVDQILAGLDEPLDVVAGPPPEGAAGLPAELPLSPGQRALWILERLSQGSAAYQVAGAARLVPGRPEAAEALRRAFQALADRHAALRTSFVDRDSGLVQVVAARVQVAVRQQDASALSPAQVEALLREAAFAPFDLECGPLFRVSLLHRREGDLLIAAAHHIVVDFWSFGVLARELGLLIADPDRELPPLPLSFGDHVLRQERWLAGAHAAEQSRYWLGQLSGAPTLALPTDRPRPLLQSFRGTARHARLSRVQTEEIDRLARASSATRFTVLLAAFAAFLGRLSGQNDFLVGAPTAGRQAPELAGVVGYFVNPIALRAELSGHPNVAEAIERARRTTLGALEHQDLPFPILSELLRPGRELGLPPLVQAMLVLQKAPSPELSALPAFALGDPGARLELGGWSLDSVALTSPAAPFDLTLSAGEIDGHLALSLGFNTDLFDVTTGGRLLGHLCQALRQLPADIRRPMADLDLVTAEERHQLLREWNMPAAALAPWPARGLHGLVERQAERTPEAIAVVCGQVQLTYGALDLRAEMLALRLQRLGAGPEALVGIFMARQPEMVVAILAVLKSGAAYLPLDPSYPRQRLALLLAESAAALVVTEKALTPLLPPFAGSLVLVDGDGQETYAVRARNRPACHPEQLAYVIYTSGSTGPPKGVAIRHAGAVARVQWALATYAPEELAGVFAATSICFDLSVFELFAPLAAGGTAVLADDALALPSLAARVTLINSVPSVVAELLRTRAMPRSARTVNLAGELLGKELAAGLLALPWLGKVYNFYGPTEDTVYSTGMRLALGEERNPPIGFPLAGGSAHVLGPALQVLPVGVAGELWLGGCGLARGYLGRPDLTADRFRPDFLSSDAGARLYRTGDRVRRLPGGELDFLGRLDRQVKVRGFRIEPGEIEAALAAQPGVREAAVVVREDAARGRSLAGFVAAEAGNIEVSWLRARLAERLPRPLIPEVLEILAALPRTANGKVDRQALARRAALSAPAAATAYVAPQTEVENLVAGIFADLVGVAQVGNDDNFFDLGGSSLLMIELRAKLRRHLGRDLSIVELFRNPTVRSLARHLSPAGAAGTAPSGAAADPRPPGAAPFPRRRAPCADGRRHIAIIGMAGRFPRAPDLAAFWRNLEQGVEAISFFSEEELHASQEPAELIRDPRYVRARGTLADADHFDAAFFGYNAREAAMMDPQHRLFLECSWEALEDSGYDAQRFAGAIGVYGGASPSTYGFRLLADPETLRAFGQLQILLTNDKDFLCARVSYKLGLQGPSVGVQTACSTSLTAVDTAAQALLLGACDMALAGGVGVTLPQQVGHLYQAGGIFSPDGHCRAFDARAQGTVSGQGVGVVVLKRLADALAAGDSIRAVIMGSAVNHDGSFKPGFTAPSVEGQARVIHAALDAAGISPETVSYVEAHGSATELGDPVEVAALTQVFRSFTGRQGFCALGSVKSNIGHLEAGSGIAGLMKAALALEHKALPPSLNFEVPNPEIDFTATPFYVNTVLRPWPEGPTPRRAAVSSFGLGGTNAHVVLEEAPAVATAGAARPWQLITLSARSEPALERAATNLAAHLRAHPDLAAADVAYTCQAGRRQFAYRRAVVSHGLDEAIRLLENGEPGASFTALSESRRPAVAFLFPGLADQYPDMGLGLYRHEPLFRGAIERCAGILAARLGFDLLPLLYPGLSRQEAPETTAELPKAAGLDLRRMLRPGDDPGRGALVQTGDAHPALFALEYSLAQLWLGWGIHPQAMLGHSVGEYVAACLAGVLSLEDALTLVVERARLIDRLPPGAMLAVPLGERQVERFLGAELSLAVVSGPSLTVLAGSPEAVSDLERSLSAEGLFYRRLNTAHAFHSKMMEPIAGDFLALVRTLELRPPEIPYLSNLSGSWMDAADATDPAYWVRHLCGTVRLGDALCELAREPHRILLEVGPGQQLGSMAVQQLRGEWREPVVLASLRGQYDAQIDEAFLLKTLGQLWINGAEIDISGLHAGERRRRVPLPTYPFERQRYAIEPRRPSTPDAGLEVPRLREEAPPPPLARPEAVKPAAAVEPAAALDTEQVALERSLAALWQELLGVPQIGRHDNFFQLGGHSLLGVQVLDRIRRTLNVEISLRDLFAAPTIAQQAAAVAAARGQEREPPICRAPSQGPVGKRTFPLSFAQERLWFFEQLQPGLAAYNIPSAVRLRGAGLAVSALAAALGEIVRRHEALRTRFGVVAGRQVQRVETVEAPLLLIDLGGLPERRREAESRRLMAGEAERPFDLTRAPLLRTFLFRLDPQEHLLLLILHHIVADGGSLGVLGHELSVAYGALVAGQSAGLAARLGELSVQYGDYAAWQRQRLSPERLEAELGSWQKRLANLPAALNLPADRPRPAAQSFRGREMPCCVEAEVVERLRALAREEGATLFMALLASFSALLARYCGQDDLVIGTAVANRGRSEIADLIGFFVNTLPLRMDLAPRLTVRSLLRRAQEVALAAYERQQMPFVCLVEGLQPQRDLSRNPFFDVMLVLQDSAENVLRLSGVEALLVPLHNATSKFDLTLSLAPVGRGLAGGLEFSTELFDSVTVERLWEHFSNLLRAMVAQPDRRAAELDLLGAAERRQILMAWSGAAAAPVDPRERLLHELFEAQAERTPESVAVIWGAEEMSYSELASRARLLSGLLARLGVGAEDRVGVLAERSPDMVVALLGVLRAGAAFLPLDPAYPADRLALLLGDCRVPVLLTQRNLGRVLPPYEGKVVFLDDQDWAGGAATCGAAAVVAAIVDPEQLAYLIYTSGSTGRPKGVGIPHRGAVAMVTWALSSFPAEQLTRVLASTSICFDLSIFELFVPLSMGGAVVLAEDVLSLASLPAAGEVSLLNTVPSAMMELVRAGAVPPSVRVVNLAGEALRRDLVSRIYELPGISAVHNLYGPSEDTTYSTGVRVPRGSAVEPTIGRPLPGRRAHVVDAQGQPVPAGVRGELWLGGAGLARGYVDRPELTAERFIPDPFSGKTGERLYRTGDMVRWSAAGELEFLGRGDHQVKVRGFRIELGEIEAVLAAHPGVQEAVVTVSPEGQRLIAHLVTVSGAAPELAETPETPTITELRAYLRERLPEYMVPGAIAFLPSLPLTANGKVDRKALSEWEGGGLALPLGAVPRTVEEELLAGIWEEVLGVEAVGRSESFFELGGHSLLATQVVSRVRQILGVDLPVRALFESPTVAALAVQLEMARRLGAAPLPPIPRVDRSGPLPLSLGQRRLWFLDQLEPESAAYNLPLAFSLHGALAPALLARSLRDLAERHETLRTRLPIRDGEPVQEISSPAPVPLPVVDLSALPIAVHEPIARGLVRGEASRPFELARGPLWRVLLVRRGPLEHQVFLTMHHIVSDGWSCGVFFRELAMIYRARAEGAPPTLPELPVQYADYAAWQRTWLRGEPLAIRLAYWRDRLAGVPPLELPTDRPRGSAPLARGAVVSRPLAAARTADLRRLARQQGASLFMTLMAAFQVILHRQSGQEDLTVGFPAFGRNRPEIENLIGFFVNTLVLRCQVSGNLTFLDLLAQVRTGTLQAYLHQDLPFDRVVEELQPERLLTRTPLFQVFFNMVNFPHREVRLPGLSFELLPGIAESSKFDLTLYAIERENGLDLALVYNRQLFDAARMRELLAQLDHLLGEVAALPTLSTRTIGELSLLTPEFRMQLPDPSAPLATAWEGAVQERIAFQALRCPDRIAIEDPHVVWTYRDVALRIESAARSLTALGIGRGDVVAVYAHRSAPLVVALLGILEAGAAFVILDPAYPPARLCQILAAARPRVLLGVEAAGALPVEIEETLIGLRPLGRVVLSRDGVVAVRRTQAGRPAGASSEPLRIDDLAYLAFTSGSTGRPKGILGPHRPLGHFLRWHCATFCLAESDRFSLLSGLSHDPLLRDVFTPLWLGATLCIPDPDVYREPARLADWLGRARISVTHLSPALAQQLADAAAGALFPNLRLAFFGGEKLRWREVTRLRRRAPDVVCVNCYGATETPQVMGYSILAAEAAARFDPEAIVPIARAIEGAQLLVLNPAGQLCGTGELGEIHVRSPYLALGYLGDEELTRRRFITNPWGTRPEDRIYRTGDLGRYLADGQIAPAGRVDTQVQIRGFRVELGDIEAAILAYPGMRAAAVRLWEGADQSGRLVGYFVAAPERGTANELPEFLASRLPGHMVPPTLIRLDALPLSANGKVDWRALPEPQVPAFPDGRFQAPETPAEQLLAEIWSAVLGVERIGRHDHFFRLGGHSLKATQVMSRIGEVFQVELPIRDLFEAPTLGQLAQRVSAALGTTAARPPLVPLAPDAQRPLSFAQHRLWFLDRFEPQSSAYNLGAHFQLDGPLARAALERALAAVARRHETLRTAFPTVDGRATLEILPPRALPLPVIDLRALPRPDLEAERLAADLVGIPFDLAQGRLLRACLLWQREERHALILVLHHIVSDGWSMGVLVHELAASYVSSEQDVPASLAPLAVQYTDYAAWQRDWLRGESLERLVAFWRGLLSGAPRVLELTDRRRPPIRGTRGSRAGWLLPPDLLARLAALGRERGATLYMVLLGGFSALLHRLSGQDDLLIGSPIANRPRRELEGLIGFFANTLVLRSRWSGAASFLDHLAHIRETSLAANAHQEMPFEKLVQELQVERDLSRTPLFQVMLTFQNAPLPSIHLPRLAITPRKPAVTTARFDWLLELTETSAGLAGSLEYSEELFDRATVLRALGQFTQVLLSLADHPESRLPELALLSEAQRHQVLAEWNDSGCAYPARHQLLHRLIEAQCARTPAAAAVWCAGASLTYRQLDRRANQLARHLQRRGVGPEGLVGVAMERSLDLAVALLAVLKAGAAYVPFDPTYPAERLAFMLADSGVRLVLCQQQLAAGLPATTVETLCVDRGWGDTGEMGDTGAIGEISDAPVDGGAEPANAAYMIYTSGSSGRPKGVLNIHAGIVNRLLWMQQRFRLDAADRVLQKTPLSFDVSVWELFWPLLAGATLVFARPGGQRDGAYLVELIGEQRITTAHFVPPMLEAFLEEEGLEALTSLRRVICSGEALAPAVAARCQRRLAAGLYNLYGPTEAAVDVTAWRCEVEWPRPLLPIGRPIANLSIHLLDGALQPVPAGVAGELQIGGAGLARGYHGRSALTAEKFIPNPFGSAGERLYRTGDVARHRPDGTIELLGRFDHQVKVRGFRIELGEIESVLAAHPAVRAAAVLALHDGSTAHLVGYLVAATAPPPTVTELRRHLGERLPDPMVPAAFVFLDAFPLTANGKLDRRALPSPSTARPDLERIYVPARTVEEEALAGIWARVLRLDQVGVQDNFFELGGDSILSIQIVAQAAQAGLRLIPRQVFEHQTIEALAAVATPLGPANLPRRGPVSGAVRLTPIQSWFFEHAPADLHHFNQAVMLHVEGAAALWRWVAARICEHHDALRSRFLPGEVWSQEIAPAGAEPPFHRLALGGLPADRRLEALAAAAAAVQGSLRVGAPLARFAFFDLGATSGCRLLIAVHHLAVDGVSWRILLADIESLLLSPEPGKPIALPAKTTSYQEWAERLSALASTAESARELAYWTDRRWENVRPLPLDLAGGANLERHSDTVTFELEVAETRSLLKEVPGAYSTFIQEVLLTALLETLSGWSGERRLLLDLEGHGREDVVPDVDTTRLVGWLTSIFPVLLELDAEAWPGEALKAVKEQLRAIPRRGLGYGLLRYLAPSRSVAERLRRLPAAQLVFNYLGQFDQTLADPALLRFAAESPGPLRSPAGERFHLLDVGAGIRRDRLVVTWKYSPRHHRRSTIAGLAETFVENLRSLIAHCSSGAFGGYTVSDFGRADLDPARLQGVLRELDLE
jgi:amino acid adenylation domain-containing protein/non-ribosomal peptide synthase protein (TIGR01720 family)